MKTPKFSNLPICIAALIVFSLVFIKQGFAQEQTKRPLTVDDFFKIKSVSNPRVSPEGEWVAFTVTETDLEKDKSETRVWMIPTAGGEAIPMTAKGNSASSPRWSPDGKYLSFLASRNEGKTQVWALNRNGGEAQQITSVKQGVGGYSWSPDGSRLLLSIKDADPDDISDDKEKKPKPWVIDRLQFKRDNVGYLNDLKTHLYTYVPGDEDVKQVTSGNFNESQAAGSLTENLSRFQATGQTTPTVTAIPTSGSYRRKTPTREKLLCN
ncbi:PD40 domain-containing protein [candidate division KSB1 bacterium]|nr:PD40 domain-containing protein [candidate division KSB1 bacterium]